MRTWTQEWSDIPSRSDCTWAMCHQARTSGSALSPSSSAARRRLPRVGAPTRAAAIASPGVAAELPGPGRLDLDLDRRGLLGLGHGPILASRFGPECFHPLTGDRLPRPRPRPRRAARQPVRRLRRQDAGAHDRVDGRAGDARRRRGGADRRGDRALQSHDGGLGAGRRDRADHHPPRGRARRFERDRDRDPAGALRAHRDGARARRARGDGARRRGRRPRDRRRARRTATSRPTAGCSTWTSPPARAASRSTRRSCRRCSSPTPPTPPSRRRPCTATCAGASTQASSRARSLLAGIAELAERGRAALLAGRGAELGELMARNFELRAELLDLEPRHLRMIELARELGAGRTTPARAAPSSASCPTTSGSTGFAPRSPRPAASSPSWARRAVFPSGSGSTLGAWRMEGWGNGDVPRRAWRCRSAAASAAWR